MPGPGGCREHVVPGYSRCIGHVLEDARAPFARCAFTVGAHRCEMPVSTLRVAGALHGETLCLVHRRLAAMGAELAVDDGTPGTGREATRRGAGREGDPQGQRMAAQRRGRYASLAATLARTLGADDAYRKEYEAVLRQVGLVPRPKATPKELVGLLDMAGIVKAEEAGEGVASEGAGHDSSRAMRNLRRLGIVNEIFKGAYAELLRVPGPGGLTGRPVRRTTSGTTEYWRRICPRAGGRWRPSSVAKGSPVVATPGAATRQCLCCSTASPTPSLTCPATRRATA